MRSPAASSICTFAQQTFNDRFAVPIETKGAPSRWVTLRALEVLRAAR